MSEERLPSGARNARILFFDFDATLARARFTWAEVISRVVNERFGTDLDPERIGPYLKTGLRGTCLSTRTPS